MAMPDARLDVEPWRAEAVSQDPFMTHGNRKPNPKIAEAVAGIDIGKDPFLTGKGVNDDLDDQYTVNLFKEGMENDPFMTHSKSMPQDARHDAVHPQDPLPPRAETPTPALPENQKPSAQLPPEPLKPPVIPFWYLAENNWYLNQQAMVGKHGAIASQFTGERFEEEVVVPESNAEKAKDWLYNQTGGRLGNQFEVKTRSVKVVDVYQDTDFPDDDRCWYRGGEPGPYSNLARPYAWERLQRLSVDVPYPRVDAAAGLFQPDGGRVYQGRVEDFYLCAALQTLGMKPQLIANVFCDMEFSNPTLGLWMLRFYKNGQWTSVTVDDSLPFDKGEQPACCQSEFWPDFAWPSLIEKAYAKMHGSYEALGGGGSVEEVLTDLTGGCCTRFSTKDVANDRLWQYLFTMQQTCVFGCNINEAECSKRGVPIHSHWASSIFQVQKFNGVPYVCVCCAAPPLAIMRMPVCYVPSFSGHGPSDGFCWLRIDDFAQLFDTIYECRLVNSFLGPPEMTGIPFSPGWEPTMPWFEQIWAFQGDVYTETTPSFVIEVPECPTEINMEVSQTDERQRSNNDDWDDDTRSMHGPLLIRFYECSPELSPVAGGEIYLIHLSAWGHTRDASCTVKVMTPGRYLAMVSLPAQYVAHRMIFRTYTTRPVRLEPVTQHRSFVTVNPCRPLGAIPYSLGGFMRVDSSRERLPQMFDEAEGRGKPMANPAYEGDTTGHGTGWGHGHGEGHVGFGSPGFANFGTPGMGAMGFAGVGHGHHGASAAHGGAHGGAHAGAGGGGIGHGSTGSAGHGGSMGMLGHGGTGHGGHGHGGMHGMGGVHGGYGGMHMPGTGHGIGGMYGGHGVDGMEGMRVVGKFGGRDAVATVEARETQDGCNVM